MYAIADIIVQPAINLLTEAVNGLSGASLVAQRGIADPAAWLGPVALLGPGWVTAVTSLLSSAALLVTLKAATSAYRLYLLMKQGVQWW